MVANADTFSTWLANEEKWYNDFFADEPQARIKSKETIFEILRTINDNDGFNNIKSRFVLQNEAECSSRITIGGEYGIDEIDVDLVLGEKSDDVLHINSLMNKDEMRCWLVEYNGVKRVFIDTHKMMKYIECVC